MKNKNILTEIEWNLYELNLRKYFTLIYNFYNSYPLEFLSNFKNQDLYTARFYTFMCSFSNSKELEKCFDHLKNDIVVKELYYNKNFWSVKEGYIEEKNEDLFYFLDKIDDLTASFVSSMIKYKNRTNLSDLFFDIIVDRAIEDLTEILNANENSKNEITAYQFAELTMIKNLLHKLQMLSEYGFNF